MLRLPVRPVRPLLWYALAYCAIGVMSAVVTNPISMLGVQAAFRIAALVLGGLAFGFHLHHEMVKLGNTRRWAAARVSVATALGGFLLGVYMVAYNIAFRSRSFGSVALVLLVWPIVTGGLGYLLAMLGGWTVARWQERGEMS